MAVEVYQYLDIFIEESKENLQTINDQLLELERNPKNLTIIQEIFRSAHTLKGMAAAMGFQDLADLTHKMENVLDAVRNGEITVETMVVDVLFEAVEYLEAIIIDISDGAQGRRDVTAILSRIEAIESGKMTLGADALLEPLQSHQPENDSPFIEKPTEKNGANNQTSVTAGKRACGNKTIRVNIERLDILMNLFEELIIDRRRLELISKELEHKELQETAERMARTSGNLEDIILRMRMVPVDQVFNRFPRMIRQLAKDLGKRINIEISGADTELDRAVIEELAEPIVHLIRNAVDHGIESPDEREQKGKPAEGTLKLQACHSGNHAFIEISDDGAGISREKVLNNAIQRAVITKEQSAELSDKQVYELLMASGFSTAEKISGVSGRGVGLDVVRNTIESLGGTIDIASAFGEGSKFSIQLPLR